MSKARIMIVEDAGVVALSLQYRLKRFGYEIPVIVSSGEEALNEIIQNDLDLVLMDIRLEGEMDGIETAQQIKEKYQIPIIYLTAHSDEKTLNRAKITEPYGYILKPYEDRELYSTIEMALYKNRMEKKLRESEQWLSTTLNSIGDGVIASPEPHVDDSCFLSREIT